MKTKILGILLGFCAILSAVHAQTIAEDGQHKELAWPTEQTCYIAMEPTNGTINFITWHVTNGSFSPTSDVSSIQGNNLRSVCVYWKNPKVTGTTAPKGSVYAEITYTQAGNTKVEKTMTIYQGIKSYNGVTPPSLTKDGGTTIPFGIQSFEIYFSKAFYLPYKDGGKNVSVQKLEWSLPSEWSSGSSIIESGEPSIKITTDYFSEGTIKVRGISSFYPEDKTNYSEIKIKRQFSFEEYPSSVKYGESSTYRYTVPLISGVSYEWNVPAGWTIVTGGNTYSATIAKNPCATSTDIKVRLKAGSQQSGWYTAPKATILPPDMTIPNIEQFRDVDISIDIPNDRVQSFSISGNGVEIVGGQGSNKLVCRFNKAGSQEINVSVSLKGCDTPFTFKKQVEVSKIQLSINGSDITCSSDPLNTYSISDLPNQATVVWSCSGGIEIAGSNIGSSCSFKGKAAGNAQVQATIKVSGETLELSKNIEVASSTGSPYISYTSDDRYINLTCHTPNIYGIREFIWDAVATGSGGSSQSSHMGPGGYYWTLPKGSYKVECIVVTQCARMVTSATIGGYRSSTYPNPVDHTLYVNISDMPLAENAISTASFGQNRLGKSYELRLFNFKGMLVRNLRVQENAISIDVSSLPEGNYFLHIILEEGKEPEVHKVVIAH
ncbi:T9SS type A sorting domain-containing protein [Parabacteroides massiliensis]|uniref:T9SS type A sorting domain-containing protein n=1 Tax=Parabacteroides massiliensis TaxID=1750560 RepID=UPI00096A5595|nr:T9SS type A sorting domain-containing protein [Parabacteroides massiliensis]